MTQYERCLSNLSYTNKDFGQIYPELLDLAKKISYKWDPSLSDESDPGVVLLKLAALMADKNNYNIDKNILELFPLSVTQDTNARQLFEQCGYYMQYYKSATATVSFAMKSEPEISQSDLSILSPNDLEIDLSLQANHRTYVIPMFTMISDIDNEVIYTTLADVMLRTDGETKDVPAIQGIITDFTINGETTITVNNIDYNNRLYLSGLNIPSNGIFIADDSSTTSVFNLNDWKQVDNLMLQPVGTKCYKFGLTADGSSCYIEFPDDIENIIGKGIRIKYVLTNGSDGNIGKQRLKQFYADTTVKIYINSFNVQDGVLLTSDNVSITNVEEAINGFNPESIDTAYKNYQKVKETFKTLVSRQDYENFMYSAELLSNGFVCDRTNDPQSSYKVIDVNTKNDVTQLLTTVVKTTSDNQSHDEMTAFDLRLYGFSYIGIPTNGEQFEKTFTVINPNDESPDWNTVLAGIDDVKFVQHNFIKSNHERIMMIKNKFPINSRIIPLSKLTATEEIDVLKNIVTALCKTLNSRVINFGESADYSLIYDTIMAADSRIRAVTLDEISYETYAVYMDQNDKIQEVQIDRNAIEYEPVPDQTVKPTSGVVYYAFDPTKKCYTAVNLVDGKITDLSEFNTFVQYFTKVVGADLIDKFQNEIFVKNVLAGKTQLLEPDTQFSHSLYQNKVDVVNEITHLTTETRIDAQLVVLDGKTEEGSSSTSKITELKYDTTMLDENENLIFLAPNTIEAAAPFSSYVKYIHNIGQAGKERPAYSNKKDQSVLIQIDDEYTMKDNEYIIFFWKDSNEDDAPYLYHKFDSSSSSLGKIVQPGGFSLKKQPNPDPYRLPKIPDSILMSLPAGKGSTEYITQQVTGEVLSHSTKEENESYSASLTEYIAKLTGDGFSLTGSTNITIRKPNKLIFNTKDNQVRNIYWSLSNPSGNKSVLFRDGETQRILQTGEHLFYANPSKTTFYTLGYGTIIERSNGDGEWAVRPMDNDKFMSDGIDYFNALWFVIPEGISLSVTETTYYQVGHGNTVSLTYVGEMDLGDESVDLNNYKKDELPKDIPPAINFRNFSTVKSTGTFVNDEPYELTNFRITYQNDEGDVTTLPMRSDPETCWRGYSLLNINMSSTKPQDLTSRQKIYYYTDEDKLTDPPKEENVFDGTGGLSLQSNMSLSLVGGERCDVRYRDILTEKLTPVNIYSYETQKLPAGTSPSMFAINWNVARYVESGDNDAYDKQFFINLIEGKYILPITFGVDIHGFEAYYCTSDRADATRIKLDTVNKIKIDEMEKVLAGTYYFDIPSDAKSLIFKAIYSPTEEEVVTPENASTTVTLGQLYKYNITMNGETYNKRLDLLIDLDTENRYNYTYVVPTSLLVADPLSASSFFDKNHVYNKYSIAQWVPDTSDVAVSSNIK